MSNLSHPAHSVQGLTRQYPAADKWWWTKLDAAVRVMVADEHQLFRLSSNPCFAYGLFVGLFKIKADKDKATEFVHLWCQNGAVRRELKRLRDMAYGRVQKQLRKERKHVPTVEDQTKLSDKVVDFSTRLIVHLGELYKEPFSMSYAEIAEATGIKRTLAVYYIKQLLDAGVLVRLEVGKGDARAKGNKSSAYKFAEGV